MGTKSNNTLWNCYPRPQMKREKYAILDGDWYLNGQPIRVPFPPQSELSGYTGEVPEYMVYEHRFTVPKGWNQGRIILHLGAVDQLAQVHINHKILGRHEGGYLPFFFDITEYVNWDEDNFLEVIAKDDLSPDYPYGKQSGNPKGMWYTQVSGIWQPVWIENVPDRYIEKLIMKPDLEKVQIQIVMSDKTIRYKEIEVPDPIHWTPENPHLYWTTITEGEDCVETYFALRTIDIREIDGIKRVCLNGKPIFLHGVLDQGYFQKGIFLPQTEEDYDKDTLAMKELGFNLLRKHIKIEPEYFYYACDKLGMLVMQDMVNNGEYSFRRDTLLPTIGFKKQNDSRLNISQRSRQIFKKHTKETIEHLYNHPCIVAYTIFNEGWGQFNSDEMYDYVKELDDTRLVDSTSGWYAHMKNDFDSEHIYFRLKRLKVKERPLFVTECGGYKYLEKDHFFGEKEYGYGTCKDKQELTARIEKMYEKMIIPGIKNGVCGCIYTQLSDVEGEINGLYTYDRAVCKVNGQQLKGIAKRIQQEIGKIKE